MFALILAVMTVDVINGLYEFSGALMLSLHVKQILKDKEVKGVAWPPFVFFASWGVWNLYYYPAVDCWWSFSGGVALVTVNLVYCALMWKYRKDGPFARARTATALAGVILKN